MNASELLKRYAAGERNFYFVDVRRTDLSATSLRKADLSGVNLSEASLIGANLSGANLHQANLSGTHPIQADLSGANLSEANLSRANLYQANLHQANLSGANLSGANLSEANLTRANLTGANLTGANLTGANLFEVILTNSLLSKTKLDGTILAYQTKSEELQRENQELKEKLSVLEIQFEKIVEKEIQRKLITNQGINGRKRLTWERLRFKSEPERKIAKALDEMGVMFFPLPSGRVMTEKGMKTRETDFLICSQGLWGILECDGEMWHPSAAKDHKRDNDYKRHGLWFIQRFTDKECEKSPHQVVRQFLDMLHKFHEDQHYRIMGGFTIDNKSESSLDHIDNNPPYLTMSDLDIESKYGSFLDDID